MKKNGVDNAFEYFPLGLWNSFPPYWHNRYRAVAAVIINKCELKSCRFPLLIDDITAMEIIHHPQRMSPFQFAREAEYFHIVLSGSLQSVSNHDVICIKTACNLRQNTLRFDADCNAIQHRLHDILTQMSAQLILENEEKSKLVQTDWQWARNGTICIKLPCSQRAAICRFRQKFSY